MWLDNLKAGDKVRVEGRVVKVIDTVISITESLVTVKCGVFNRKTGRIHGGSMYDHTKLKEFK